MLRGALQRCIRLPQPPPRCCGALAAWAAAPAHPARALTRASAAHDGQFQSAGVLGRRLEELAVRVRAMQQVCFRRTPTPSRPRA